MAEKEPEKKGANNEVWWRPAVMMFFELSGWIAGPVIIAIFLGNWLDEKYGTEPWLFLSSVGLAMVISIVGIVRGAGKAIKEMEKFDTKKKNNIKMDKPND